MNRRECNILQEARLVKGSVMTKLLTTIQLDLVAMFEVYVNYFSNQCIFEIW
jgi:hypothetical protein